MDKKGCDTPECLIEIQSQFKSTNKNIEKVQLDCKSLKKTLVGEDGRSGMNREINKKADWITLWGIMVVLIGAIYCFANPVYSDMENRIKDLRISNENVKKEIEGLRVGITYLVDFSKELKEDLRCYKK